MQKIIRKIIREEIDRVLAEQVTSAEFAIQNGRLVVRGKLAKLDIDAMGKFFNDVKIQKSEQLSDGSVELTLQAGTITKTVTVKKSTVDGILKSFSLNPAQPYKHEFFGGAFTISPVKN